MSDWRNGERGPKCECGNPTLVKTIGDGAVLLCMQHDNGAGAVFVLPKKKPASWPRWDGKS